MSPAFLRAADGMGWAIFVLGLVCALATLLFGLAILAALLPSAPESPDPPIPAVLPEIRR